MRHLMRGPKLGRKPSHRKALLRNLTTSLVKHERIVTTIAKAKAVRTLAEHVITLGKRGTLAARNKARGMLFENSAVNKVWTKLAPRFADRPGGYTRIVKLGPRRGDRAPMALIEYVGRLVRANPGGNQAAGLSFPGTEMGSTAASPTSAA